MADLTKKVVKIKKLQKIGDNSLCIIIPKKWIEEMNWNQDTKLIAEFLPHRKTMILSENNKRDEYDPIADNPNSPHGKKDSDFIPV